MIRGLIVNKFRGDLNLFTDGVKTLEDHSGVPVLGVVPYIHNHGLAEEDAATIRESLPSSPNKTDIAVIHFPHISNFDDFDPLTAETAVQVRYVQQANQLGRPAAILLPGTKNTLSDLQWLHKTGLAESIQLLAAAGTSVVGLCGGYQMLGERISDENAVESVLKKVPGLGLLPSETRFESAKTVTRSQAKILVSSGFAKEIQGQLIQGYEIHMGQTYCEKPFCHVFERESEVVDSLDGAYSPDGKIWGTYLHGVFDNDSLRIAWLESLGVKASTIPFAERRNRTYDLLADVLEASLEMKILDQIIAEGI
jgi:adenosylcobyric acid synthase